MTYDIGATYRYSHSKQDYTNEENEYRFPNRTVLSESKASAINTKSNILNVFLGPYTAQKKLIFLI
jgi:hypothetical protein